MRRRRRAGPRRELVRRSVTVTRATWERVEVLGLANGGALGEVAGDLIVLGLEAARRGRESANGKRRRICGAMIRAHGHTVLCTRDEFHGGEHRGVMM